MAKSGKTQRNGNGETGETSLDDAGRIAAARAEEEARRNTSGEIEQNRAEQRQNGQDQQVGLNAVLMMLAQVLERLPAVVVPPAGGGPQQPHAGDDREEVHVEEEIPVARIPSYLKVMDYMMKLGTKYFSGGSNAIEADEWRIRMERNFESIRCPEQYKKDIAVHYLEGDAHIWWKGVSGRQVNANCSWETFSALFRTKYFPPEAYDRLEGAFLELRQGTKTVREYEAEFNQLKKYAGRELEDEQVQVRRFMRGLRIELRNGCLVRNFDNVAELVEKAALLEAGIAEEKRLNGGTTHVAARPQGQGASGSQHKKKWDENQGANKSAAGRSACATCGRMHQGVCESGSGACYRCGSLTHKARDCPEGDVKVANAMSRDISRKIALSWEM